jgi:type I restriction enzyme S subunit
MISATDLGRRYPTKPLGEVVEFLDHLRKPVTASERELGPYPYYGANGQQDSVAGYLFDEPLILVAEDGGFFGEPQKTIAYRVNGKCWVNNHAHVLRPRPDVDIGYLCRHLEQYDVRPFTSGTTRLKLNKSQAQRIPVALPPLPEQKRIAAILDAADALRAKRRESIEQLDSLIQATFLEMFGDPVTNPKGWEIDSLHNHGSLKNGLNFSSSENGKELICLGVGDFKSRWCVKDVTNLTAINLTSAPSADYLLHDGDLVFVRSNGNRALVGRCVVVYPHELAVTFSGFCIRYRSESKDLAPIYLAHLFRSDSMKSAMLGGGRGANIQNINQGVLTSLRIPKPPRHLQQGFASIVESIEQQKARLKVHLAELDTLFASLQSRAFNGELVA